VPNTLSTEHICYSPSRAAELLGIGKSTLFNLLARGEIRAKKLGSRTLISASELARYVGTLPDAEFHAYEGGAK
jgi:excisionase family DNA binding protein